MSSESGASSVGEEQEQRIGLISNMEARAEHQTVRRYNFIYGITSLVGAVLVVLVFTWCLEYRGGFSWTDPKIEFNWHPFLMILGLVFLYSQAMLTYRTGRSFQKRQLKLCHASIQFVAFVLAAIALKAAFDSHNYATPPIANLYSLHSWIGLTTFILFACQFVGGFVSFLFPRLSKTLRATVLPLHTNFGTILFILVLITAAMGITEKALWVLNDKYSSLPGEAKLINFIGVFLAFFGALTLYLINEVTYKRTVQPEDEISLAEGSQ